MFRQGLNSLRLALLASLLIYAGASNARIEPRKNCVIPAKGDGSDDSPAILEAFHECRNKGRITFQNATYNIHKFMVTTDLSETDINIYGTLKWSNDTAYWLENSYKYPTGFQNGSAAWFLGGTNVTVNGFGHGTLDGNGQVWYDLVKGQSNYPGRPHGLAVWEAENFNFKDLRMVQSQMWTLLVTRSKNIVFDGLFIRSESSSKQPARNTDGADTLNSNAITFRNTYIRNGDDAIAIKGNSTNILIEDCTFENSLGLAFGSLGQYPGAQERVENIVARRLTLDGTRHAAYIKTWTGEQVGYPPNGGGGGTGYIRNISLVDFTIIESRNAPFNIKQCTSFSGVRGDCDSSLFEISDIGIRNWTGTTKSTTYVAEMDCAKASGGCRDIKIEDVRITNADSSSSVGRYKCSDVSSTVGFICG
ncbi:Glycoside hydrolase family 28 [Paramyrothecium foliicola]|nr:Glycoside hydrolase family 28 [Paramyrothecium foliicola]